MNTNRRRAGSAMGAALLVLGIGLVGTRGGTALAGGRTERKPRKAGKGRKVEQLRVYIGTYTGGNSKGVYVSQLDLKSGTLSAPELAAETPNPSFLTLHPNGRFLYACNEIGNYAGTKSGSVSAFAIGADGKLTLLNQQSSHGGGPCYVSMDRAGRALLVANYGGGSIAALAVQPDGRLGEATAAIQHQGSGTNPQRQEGPHAHSINPGPGDRFAFAADLGLDKLLVYRFDPAKGTLKAHEPPSASVAAGSGPRHLAFHPSGRYAYTNGEMTSTVIALELDADRGTLKPFQTLSTLPEGFQGNNSTAEIQVHPSGKFVYVSNRGHDSLAIFAVDERTGKLTAVGHQPSGGKTPRNFGIDPTGAYLLAANQESDSLAVFRIDAATGRLTPTGQAVQAPKPVCVKMQPLAP